VIELGTTLLTIIVMLISMATHPQHARCPPGFVVGNIRTSSQIEPRGTYTCDRPALGGDDDVKTGKNTARPQPGQIRGRIYCTGGTSPIVVADPEVRTVGCSR
jgi:hypothetical protein